MFIPSALAIAAALWIAFFVALAIEKHIFDQPKAFWKSLSKLKKTSLVVVLLGFIAFAGTKPTPGGGSGDGDDSSSTNQVEVVEGESNTNLVEGVDGEANTNDVDGVGLGLTLGGTDGQTSGGGFGALPRSGMDSTSPLEWGDFDGSRITDGDYAAGFVLQGVGTNETFDFSAPEGAFVATNWMLRGAATDHQHMRFADWTFPFGDGILSNLTAFANGILMPNVADTNHFFSPFGGKLGVAPTANWGELSETNRPCIFWRTITDDNAVICTWQNALLDRVATNPVSFQVEYRPGGSFIFRYDLSRLASDDLLTNVVIGVRNGDAGWLLSRRYAEWTEVDVEVGEPVEGDVTEAVQTQGVWQVMFNGRPSAYYLQPDADWTSPTNAPLSLRSLTSLRFARVTEADRDNTDRDGDSIPTEDEIFLYGTDPGLADTDFDGMPDNVELERLSDPLRRDSDNDGLVDGSDPDPLTFNDDIDDDEDGINDDYERHWFGDTSVIDDPTEVKEDGFTLETEILAGINPTNVSPAAVTYITNSLASWKLFDGFAAIMSGAGEVVWQRSFTLNKTSPWQQYFISAAPDTYAGWMLEGMQLEWADSNGNSGSVARSPSGDSYHLPFGTNDTSSVTLRLRSTRPFVRSVSPLYLIAYVPEFKMNGGQEIHGTDGVTYSVFTDGSASSINLQIDRSHRPSSSAVGDDETDMGLFEEMSQMSGDFSFEGDSTGGTIYANRPGIYEFPEIDVKLTAARPARRLFGNSNGNGRRVVVLSPRVGWTCEGEGCAWGGLGYDWSEDSYIEESDYPFDTGCLRRILRYTYGGGWWCDGTFFCSSGLVEGGGVSVVIEGNRGTVYVGGVAVWSDTAEHIHDHDCGGGDTWDEEPCCDPCQNGNCDIYEKPQVDSMKFRIPLGNPAEGFISGFAYIDTEEPITITQSSFQLKMHPMANYTDSTSGGNRQIVCSDSRGRKLLMENIAGGVRVTVRMTATDTLEHIWEITNVGSPSVVRFRQISRQDNVMLDQTFTYRNGDWTLFDNIARIGEELSVQGGINNPYWNGVKRETRTKYDEGHHMLSQTITEQERVGECENAVIRETYREEWDGYNWGYSYMDYWDDPAHPERHGRMRLRTGNMNTWRFTDFDGAGREIIRVEQRNGSDCNAETWEYEIARAVDWENGGTLQSGTRFSGMDDAFVTLTSYAPMTGDSAHIDDASHPRIETKYVVKDGVPTFIGRTWTRYTRQDYWEYDAVMVETWRASYEGADAFDSGNAYSYKVVYTDSDAWTPLVMRNAEVESEDESGVFTENYYDTWGGVVTVWTRKSYHGVSYPTYTVTEKDPDYGYTLRTSTYLTESDALIDETVSTYDDQNRLRTTTYFDGTAITNAYSCCRLLWQTDREGRKTVRSAVTGEDRLYWANEETWLAEVSTNGGYLVTQHFCDGLGRETNTVTTIGYTPGEFTQPSAALAERERVVTKIEYPYGGTSYSRKTDGRGAVTESSTYRSTTEEETSEWTYTNGMSVLSVHNSAIRGGGSRSYREWDGKWTEETRFSEYDSYGWRSDFSVTSSSDYGTVTNSITVYDLLGRRQSTETPLGITTYNYDDASPRVRSAVYSAAGISREAHYLYSPWGESVGVRQDDVTQRTDVTYEEISNEWWKVTSETATAEDGVTNSLTVTREQMTGLCGGLRSRKMTDSYCGAKTTSEAWKVEGITTTLDTSTRTGPVVSRMRYGIEFERDADGETRYTSHDAFGRGTLTERGAIGSADRVPVSFNCYTALGDLIAATVYTNGNETITTTYGYDPLGRRVRTADALGGETLTGYDANGNVISEDGVTYPARYEYDTQGRRVSSRTNREGDVWDETRWTYDPATGLCLAKTYADGTSTTYEYTEDGLLERTRYASGHWELNLYNDKRQIVGVQYDDVGSATFERDAFGRETSAANALAAYAYQLSCNGIATNETAMIGGAAFGLRRGLDVSGRRVTFGLCEGYAAQTIGYREDGRVGTISNADAVVEYAYSVDCRDMGYSLALTNGVVFTRTLGRDPYRRTLVTSVGNSIGCDFAYEYDALSRQVRRNSDTFAYNGRSEVTGAIVNGGTEGYAYDNIGNQTMATRNAVTNLYEANALNQYVVASVGGRPFEPSYDLDGNMTAFGVCSCVYDSASRLSMVYTNGVLYSSNYYDHLGRRVRLVTPHGTHTFVYDGWNVVLELIDRCGTTERIEYYWGKDASGTLDGAGGVGALLYLKRNGTVFVPIYDAYGDIVEYRGADGSLAASYVYDTFGLILAKSGPLADSFRFRHATKGFDAATGIYYYIKRFYSPVIRRWLNRDPLQERGGLNLYAFCRNNALIFLDKDGQAFFAVRKLDAFDKIYNWSELTGLPKDIDDFANDRNNELLHEQLFYGEPEDPGNSTGWASNSKLQVIGRGDFIHEPFSDLYRVTSRGYNDCVMAKAENKVGKPPYYLLFGPLWGVPQSNCQDWAQSVRDMYYKLLEDPKVVCECGLLTQIIR